MDLEFDEAQVELRDNFRRQLSDQCDETTRRCAADLPGAVDRTLWQRLADAGVFGVDIAADRGGLGAGAAEAVLVHEEIGRAAVPGPVVTTALIAAIRREAIVGSSVVAGAFDAAIVEHLDGCDAVARFGRDAVALVPRDAFEAAMPLTPLDPLTPVHQITGGWPPGEELAVGDLWLRGTLYTAATSVGLAAAAVDMAVAYSLQREQFGRSIGSFQAIKHLLADALAATEVARAAVHSAAVTTDEEAISTEASRAIACARVLASRAAKGATRACVQVHGGIGYTWELDAHLYLKRAQVLDTHFETPDGCRALLVAGV